MSSSETIVGDYMHGHSDSNVVFSKCMPDLCWVGFSGSAQGRLKQDDSAPYPFIITVKVKFRDQDYVANH